MSFHRVACLVFFAFSTIAAGCGDDSGGGGSGGAGGAGVTPGLWVGEMGTLENPADGWALCLYVSADGSRLQAAEACNIDPADPQPYSVDLLVENRGTTPTDEPCSFDIRTVDTVSIRDDGSFLVTLEEGAVTVEIQGTFDGNTASGSAQATGIPTVDRCTLGSWTAEAVSY
ncbi:MAG: hypothetical protein WBG86_05450 [Polyangiales bacterium]